MLGVFAVLQILEKLARIEKRGNLGMKVLFLFLSLWLPSSVAANTFNWQLFGNRWENYVQNPSRSKSYRLYTLLPRKAQLSVTSENEKEILEFVSSNLKIVDERVRSSHRDAIRLAFRLLALPSFEIRESMQLALSSLIRTQPELFLTNLKREEKSVISLLDLLKTVDARVQKTPTERKTELARRLNALKQVDNPRLLEVRNRCIETLEKIAI